MEQREHPRIQIPLLVELTHPAVGTVQTTARDISAGGLFVRLPGVQIKPGGKLKLRLLTILPSDTQPKPTVEMEVKRVTDEGLGLAFINRTAEHLWSSVQRLRSELAIGRDYFQVHQCLAVTHADKGVLLVQQNGKWLLPGHYLMVGENASSALRAFAKTHLQLELPNKLIPVATDSAPDISIVEAATYSVTFTTACTTTNITLSPESGYKDWRWLLKLRDLKEITFASDSHRDETLLLLTHLFSNEDN
jgi:ADP-ribose pyrophosphatase YjhB (NUDIX family)